MRIPAPETCRTFRNCHVGYAASEVCLATSLLMAYTSGPGWSLPAAGLLAGAVIRRHKR
jgi:hypothetical protein